MKKIIVLAVAAMLIASQAMAAITITNTITAGPYSLGGNSVETVGVINLAGTYETNGFTFSPNLCGVSHIQSLILQGEDGYQFFFNASTGKVFVFQTATLTPTGTVASTFSGTGATISPTAALAGAPVLTGTPATVSTTVTLTDGTSATPVYYSGGAFYTEGGGTVALTSSTYTPEGTISTPSITVTGATYTPAGSVASAFTGAATTAAALAEVGNGTSLASVDKISYRCVGW